MADNTQLNAPIHPGGDIVRDIDKGGKKVQVVTFDMGGAGPESLVSGYMPVRTNGAFGELSVDAWGVPKVSIPHSIFHGLFTFDIPPSQWFMFHAQTQVYSSSNIYSSNGEGIIAATAAIPSATLESKFTPRYQPNRGHLYSTACWCPSKTADGIRDWGVGTIENGVYFRLEGDGNLYAVIRRNLVERQFLIDTSRVSGFDVQKGNIYDIQYQWRGVGNYIFYINLVQVHIIENLGALTNLGINDPAVPAMFRAVRVTQDVEIHAGCVDITSENGNDDRLQYGSVYAEQTLNGTDKPLLVFNNPLQIGTATNTRMLELSRISISCDKKSQFKVWITRDPAAITGATLVARGNGSYVSTDSTEANPTAVHATAVNTALMSLITVIPVQANVTKEANNPFQTRIDFPIVRGDYLVITGTVSTGTCEVVAEWGEAI